MPIKYNLEEDYSYQQGVQKGRKQEREIADLELQERLRKAIIDMLMLGATPEQIAEDLEVSLELVKEIQQELN